MRRYLKNLVKDPTNNNKNVLLFLVKLKAYLNYSRLFLISSKIYSIELKTLSVNLILSLKNKISLNSMNKTILKK